MNLHTLKHWFFHLFHGHHHDHSTSGDDTALITNREAIRTVWLALALLSLTTLLQMAVVVISGSTALLADTLHNLGDSLNSIPLLIAFYFSRRAATRRYTYGYGRLEDVAGILIVLSIVISAAVILGESLQKLINPQPLTQPLLVALMAVIGFLGNEGVAWLQIRTGRKIGSEAMVVDGLHARIDGLTSLAVLIAVLGSVLGLPIIDPIIGLLIGITILLIAKDAVVRIWYRLMDAVEPALVDQIEQFASEVEGIAAVRELRVRWLGHELHIDMLLSVSSHLTTAERARLPGKVQAALHQHIRHIGLVYVQFEDAVEPAAAPISASAGGLNILPERYQLNPNVSAAPMGAAALVYAEDGHVAWDKIWTGFCELALAGGPPHRGSLLEPAAPEVIASDPHGYEQVLAELERGIALVTGLPTRRSTTAGWIGLVCESEAMALWLLRAIVVENVSVRREGNTLYFPASPTFRLEREIKNVITVIAKTNHYWQEHASPQTVQK